MAFYKQEKFLFLKMNFVVSTIIIGSMYGLSDEFHQYFVEGRTMDFWDWIADSIGVTLGAFFFSNNNIRIQEFIKYFKSTKKK
jgi:VanZ family protein